MPLSLGAPFVVYPVSALADHVMDVIYVSSKKEMIGPDARRHVAMMANEQPFGDRAEVDFPGETMGALSLTFYAEKAITKGCGCACPEPTRISLLDKFPESLFWFLYYILTIVSTAVTILGGLTAAAFTKFGELKFWLGKLWGIMGLHKKFTFLVSRPRAFPRRWDNCFSPSIIPQLGLIV